MFSPIPNVYVVGLGHKARNGKDTTAGVFQDFFGSSCRRYAFADALRAVARVDHGMTTKDAPLLQRLGTEVYRAKDPNIWAHAAYWTIHEQQPLVAVVSDVRFPNEAQMVKDMGGALIKCVRLMQDGRPYIDPSRDPKHLSETALDNYKGWDHSIYAASVKELEYQAVHICEQIAVEIGYYAAI